MKTYNSIENEINQKLPLIIREAGKIASSFFANNPAMEYKKDNTIVTEADAAVQKYIVDELGKLGSSIPVIAEEDDLDTSLLNNSEYTWVIDPIDGTSQYANDLDNWVIAIALLKNYKPCAGWIYQPTIDKLYYAPIEDTYAYIEIRGKKSILPKISKKKEYSLTKKDIICYGSRTFSEYKLERTKARTQCLGSLTVHALEAVMGHSIAAFSFDNKIWDICAVAEIANRTDVNIRYVSGKEVDYKAIITSKDKALEDDMIIAHENIFPIIKKHFIKIELLHKNPIKKWVEKYKHNEILYKAMVWVIYPLTLLISFFRIILGITTSSPIDKINILYAFIATLYFSTCWFFSKKSIRGDDKYNYNIIYFLFYLIENIVIYVMFSLLFSSPYIENRQLFYILGAIYMIYRTFMIMMAITLNENFILTFFTVLGFIGLYFSSKADYYGVEVVGGGIFIVLILFYGMIMIKNLTFKYKK